MNTSRLLLVATRIVKLERQIATLHAEARQLITHETAESKSRKKMSPAARKKISEAMKKKWATRKKNG
jgi:hypothetical protein